jgi:putative sugar O-methyltransferase
VKNNKIVVSGDSGFYIPPENQFLPVSFMKFLKYLKSPSQLFRKIERKFFSLPRLFSYKVAFELVLNHRLVSDPDLSPYRINHLQWKDNKDLFLDSNAVKLDFENWSKRKISDHIYLHYYYFNILKTYIKNKKIKNVMEIGAGNGNFASILFKNFPGISLILVDLPEMVPVSFSYLTSVFPNARIILPNEFSKNETKEYDILLLTTEQTKLINDSSLDLIINCHSFQEMPYREITNYFKLIDRVIRKGGHFFTANRIEKIPVGDRAYVTEQDDLPNRFHLYPWNKKAKVLVDEVSRFSRLVQLDGIGIRLEITKP